jgi:hypothetical protein
VVIRGYEEICCGLSVDIELDIQARADHPLRPIREIANAALVELTRDFAVLYSDPRTWSGRWRSLLALLQTFYSVLGAAGHGAERV